MSDNSDIEYSSSEEEEEEEEVTPVYKKGNKPIPHTFGSTVTNQHIIGDAEEGDGVDYESEDEDEEMPTGGSAKASGKSAKGRKRKNKKEQQEENESDYEQEANIDIAEESDDDSDVENPEEEDDNDQEYDEDDEDGGSMEGEDEEPEKYMHHFEKEITQEYILETHPECIPVSITEVRAMLNVVRNSYGVPIDDFHKTVPIVTKFEKARIIGQRAAQLNAGAKPYVDVIDAIDGSTIAEVEFNMKKIPVIIKRPLPNGAFEYWRLKDLEIMY
jgi:DNA-directed RNA polymerase subunit K/omega